jgi:hypothetical protein
MLAVAGLHAIAQGDQIFVCIHNEPVERLSSLWIVRTSIKSHPSPTELAASADLAPR